MTGWVILVDQPKDLPNAETPHKVITTSGIHGLVTRLGEQSVQIQIADKVRIEVSKVAIGGYQGQPPVVETPSKP